VQLETIQEGTTPRYYRVYRPATPEPRPALVLDLHGAGTNGFFEEVATRLNVHAERRGWIVAYPDAVVDGWEPYGCCRHPEVDDVAFIANIISRLEATDRVDPDRIYVTGLSRGGMMAYRLACELSSSLAAIAPVAGNMADENGDVRGVPCRPDRPVSVLAIHGSADRSVPIAGGGRFAPFSNVTGAWRELNECPAEAATTSVGASTVMTWQCRAGSEVQSVVVHGAGHTWPGTPLASLPWAPAASLDASSVVADFFAAHRRARAIL